MKFMQKICKQVESHNFLSTFLLLAFKFYIHKMILFLLNKDLVKNYYKTKDKDRHPKLVKAITDMEGDVTTKMEKMLLQLKDCKEREQIPNF